MKEIAVIRPEIPLNVFCRYFYLQLFGKSKIHTRERSKKCLDNLQMLRQVFWHVKLWIINIDDFLYHVIRLSIFGIYAKDKKRLNSENKE